MKRLTGISGVLWLLLVLFGLTILPQTSVSAKPSVCAEETLYEVNFADTDGSWTPSRVSGDLSLNWQHSSGSWFAPDDDDISELLLTGPTLQVPANASQIRLEFNHQYEFEGEPGEYWDGGQVQLGINGSYQTIEWYSFMLNGYNAELETESDHPFGGEWAFSGDSGGSLLTRAVLYMIDPGDNIQLRFRLGTDEATGDTGWSIADVRVLYCDNIPAEITSTDNVVIPLNEPFSHTFTATGKPTPTFSYSDENLPPGVTRDGDTLSGTPTEMGTFTITATAENGVLDVASISSVDGAVPAGYAPVGDTQVFTIIVRGDEPYFTSPASARTRLGSPFSHTFTAAGNPAPTFSYSDEHLPPGVTRSGDTLSGTPTEMGTFTITATAHNSVVNPPPYTGSANALGAFIDPGITQVFTITVHGDEPYFTSPVQSHGMANESYTHTFSAVGNPAPTLSYSSENLPPGVTRTGDTLSGIPTLSGTYSITVTASNGVAPDAVQVHMITIGSLPPPPPSPYAEDVNFDNEAGVRTGVPESLVDSIHVRELYRNGQPVQWLGGDLYSSGSIGNLGVMEMGVRQAIDIFSPTGLSYFNGGAVFCLRGEGTLIWMAASHAPRIAEIIGSYTVDDYPGYTCATLFEPGTLVLVSENPLS